MMKYLIAVFGAMDDFSFLLLKKKYVIKSTDNFPGHFPVRYLTRYDER